MRFRKASTGEIKPRVGQEEAGLYIGHREYYGPSMILYHLRIRQGDQRISSGTDTCEL